MEYIIEVEGTEVSYSADEVADFCVNGADVRVHTADGGLDIWLGVTRWFVRTASQEGS